ncbi:hypothetical protein BV898_15232 [Hypsibius exemplaris]|uniref:Uncharacterized protein n=1 Tax=Hypsibius exemplaris TaxID=2072580 RepID=A0A9X6NB50_HYPEX|nr:hypothetical protein BV898_15232 [Hypsibius exemplaris]
MAASLFATVAILVCISGAATAKPSLTAETRTIIPPMLETHAPFIAGGRLGQRAAWTQRQQIPPRLLRLQSNLSSVAQHSFRRQVFRSQVEAKLGSLQEYTAVSYQPQAVRGTNYYVKVRVAPDTFAEVQFGEPFPENGVQGAGTFHGARPLGLTGPKSSRLAVH